MEAVINLILLFFVYSFVGWCIEVTLKYFQFHRLINRGFFTGPLLPIYGSGAVLITVGVEALRPLESGVGVTFLLSFVLCGVLEYMTSYVMEKRFHARWWDYSQKPMNLHGRVWIGNLILFGLGGVLIVHLFNPPLLALLERVPLTARKIAAGLLSALFVGDYVLSHFVLKMVKLSVENSKADSTEAISSEVRLLLSDRSVFHRRFVEAYPEVIYRTERITARMEQVRAESERLRREAEQRVAEVNQRLEEGREQLAAHLEPTAAIRSELIRQQSELIGLLYDEQRADARERALKEDIDRRREKLRARESLLPEEWHTIG